MPRIPPPEVVATWPAPNYDHPASRGTWLIAVEVTLIVITFFVVLARMYTRGRIIRSFGVDDWLIIPAFLICLGLTIATCLATIFGYGIHIWDIRPHLRTISLRFAWVTMLLFTICVTITKLSILFFYLRLSNKKTYRMIVYSCMTFICSWGIIYVFAVIFYCVPTEAYWNIHLSQERCLNEGATLISNAVINMLADLLLIVIPIPLVWNVQLPRKQRMQILGVFALGILVCFAGMMRLIYIVQTVNSNDSTWDGFMCWIWVAIECDVGIICASIPSLKPLLAHITSTRSSSIYATRRSTRPIPAQSAVFLTHTRSKLESIWDASEEQVCTIDTTIQGPKHVKGAKSLTLGDKDTRRSFFMERAARKENGSQESFDMPVEMQFGGWDVTKTTEIEITTMGLEDEAQSPSHLDVRHQNVHEGGR